LEIGYFQALTRIGDILALLFRAMEQGLLFVKRIPGQVRGCRGAAA
jgi:hypothetical protein